MFHIRCRAAVFVITVGTVLAASAVFSRAQDQSAQPEAQTSNTADPERQHALELYSAGKMVEAMPLLEKLAATYPKDIVMWEAWGVAVLSFSQTITDPDLRRQARMRSRSVLLKAKDLGDNSNLLQTLLSMIPEDGSASTFSNRKEVDETMQQAETDFARGDYDKAREGYVRALLLDPNLYTAALFTGDVYFKQHQLGSAGEWFSRAVQIDPNRETAYRYWGDALMQAGKMDEARSKFIEAVIADPYNRNPWMGLGQWADRNHVKLNYVKLQDRSETKVEGGKTTVTLDLNLFGQRDDSSLAAWIVYGGNRSLWQREKFKKEFPNEPKYRRTLREEAESLGMVADVAEEMTSPKKKKKKDQPPTDASLVALIQIKHLGLLEPFVLLNRADNEIAQDYAGYRDANRDKLRRYMDEFVVPKTPADKTEQTASP